MSLDRTRSIPAFREMSSIGYTQHSHGYLAKAFRARRVCDASGPLLSLDVSVLHSWEADQVPFHRENLENYHCHLSHRRSALQRVSQADGI